MWRGIQALFYCLLVLAWLPLLCCRMEVNSLVLVVETGLPVPAQPPCASSWFQARQSLSVGGVQGEERWTPVTLGSDSEVASGVAAWSLPLSGCLWVDGTHLAFC